MNNKKLPRDRWRVSEIQNFLVTGSASISATSPGFDYKQIQAAEAKVLSWLREGRLRAYGRGFHPDESHYVDQARAFQVIECERWVPRRAWLGNDELCDPSNFIFRDIFVDKREALQLVNGGTESDPDRDPEPAPDQSNVRSRGRRPQHDREHFWRTAAAALTELPKQAAFVAALQEAYVQLRDANVDPPGETFLKERYTELKTTFEALAQARRKPKADAF